jgi:hypothetical protein
LRRGAALVGNFYAANGECQTIADKSAIDVLSYPSEPRLPIS